MAQENIDRLEVPALVNILLNPDSKAETHRAALSALSHQPPVIRTARLVQVLSNIVMHAGRYDQQVMESLIDILGTDPDADATVGMIESLPGVLEAGMNRTLTPDFREYYYASLLTRQRDEDLAVWAEMLPTLEPKALVAMILDPVAGGLVEAIGPVELLDRQPEPDRTRYFIAIIMEIILSKGNGQYIQLSIQNLRKGHDPDTMEEGVRELAKLWEQKKKEGEKAQIKVLEKVLGLLDNEPRSAAEKLRGKRPWAS